MHVIIFPFHSICYMRTCVLWIQQFFFAPASSDKTTLKLSAKRRSLKKHINLHIKSESTNLISVYLRCRFLFSIVIWLPCVWIRSVCVCVVIIMGCMRYHSHFLDMRRTSTVPAVLLLSICFPVWNTHKICVYQLKNRVACTKRK